MKEFHDMIGIPDKKHNVSQWTIPDAHLHLFVYTLITLIVQCNSLIAMNQDNKPHYVSGSVRVDLPDPLFYSTYIPVIYEIDAPDWGLRNLNIKWPANFSTACYEQDTFGEDWNNMACPVVHYMYEVTERYMATLLDWKSLNSTSKSTKIDSVNCDIIGPHFTSYTLGMEETTDYLHEDLMSCPLGQVIYEKLDHDEKNLHMNASTYGTMLNKFIEEYVALGKNRVKGFNRFTAATNAFSSLQSLQLLEYVYVASKWTQAISTCADGRIPYTLIPRESLAATLKEVQQTLGKKENKKFQLTIDHDDLSTYYKTELADCVFNTKSFMVRILVPLKKAELEYKLSLLTAIPFLRHYGNVADICQYSSHPTVPVLVEKHTNFTIPTDCGPAELCHVPDPANRPMIDYCLHAVIKNSTQDIIDFCEIQCQYLDLNHLPYFRRLSSDQYVILGQSDMDIFINCDSQPYKVILPPMPTGALEVTLPCSCELVHQQQVLHSSAPCGNSDLKLREIRPVSWSPETMLAFTTGKAENSHKDKISSKDTFTTNSDSDSPSVEVKLYILSGVVLILFCFNGLLMVIINRLSKRIMLLEKSTSGNFFENPLQMYAHANDD